MAKRKHQREGKIFHAEAPLSVWPPTLTQRPRAFALSLRRIRGRGLSILAGAVLMGLGFFVMEGGGGNVLGLVGAAMVVAALAWHWRRSD